MVELCAPLVVDVELVVVELVVPAVWLVEVSVPVVVAGLELAVPVFDAASPVALPGVVVPAAAPAVGPLGGFALAAPP